MHAAGLQQRARKIRPRGGEPDIPRRIGHDDGEPVMADQGVVHVLGQTVERLAVRGLREQVLDELQLAVEFDPVLLFKMGLHLLRQEIARYKQDQRCRHSKEQADPGGEREGFHEAAPTGPASST